MKIQSQSVNTSDLEPAKESQESFSRPTKKKEPGLFFSIIIRSIITCLYFLSLNTSLLFVVYFVADENNPTVLASLGIGNTLFIIGPIGMTLALNIGLTALTSQAHGAGDHELVGLLLHKSLVINTIVIFICFLVSLKASSILQLIGVAEEIADLSAEYVIYSFGGLFFFAYGDTLRAYLIAQGIFFPQLILQIICMCLHYFYCWFFIAEMKLGVNGASIALTLNSSGQLLFILLYILKFKRSMKSWFFFKRDSLNKLGYFFLNLANLGTMVYLEWFANAVAALIAANYITDEIAGGVLFTNFNGFIINIPIGISVTLNAFVGTAMGERNLKRVKKSLLYVAGLVLTISAILIPLFYFNQDTIYHSMTDNETTIMYAKTVLEVYLFVMAADFLQIQFGAYLRGIARESVGFIIFLCGFYGVGIPLAYLIGTILEYGISGIRMGMGIGIYCVFILDLITIFTTNYSKQMDIIEDRNNKTKGKKASLLSNAETEDTLSSM